MSYEIGFMTSTCLSLPAFLARGRSFLAGKSFCSQP